MATRTLDNLGIVEVLRPPTTTTTNSPCGLFANRRFGGKSLLEWVVRRVTDCQRLDRVVVLCGPGVEPSAVRQCAPPDVAVFSCESSDPLGCLAAAVRKYATKAVVRVRVDRPFVDPELIDRLVTSAQSKPGCDFVSFCLGDGRPAVQSQIGVFAEWCRADAIERADQEATVNEDRSDCMRYVFSHADLFQLRLIPVPTQLDRDDLRLGIEGEEDWEHAQVIYDALGPEGIEWQAIAGLLDHQPEIRERMAVLNQSEPPSALRTAHSG